MKKLSVVLATRNEEWIIRRFLESIKDIADEIIVVDERSIDKTAEIAKEFGAKVLLVDHEEIFHISKQKAIDMAKGDWILMMDADELITKELGEEIRKIIEMDDSEIEDYEAHIKDARLFKRHFALIQKRDGRIGTDSKQYAAFFIARLNLFLGKYLKYGGVYPDGVIRLVKRGKAYWPCKDVHEQMVVEGRVGWLQYPIHHISDPTLERYLRRNSRYIDLIVSELEEKKERINPITISNYIFVKPTVWFLMTTFRHKGLLDGWRGVVFSFFSAARFPRAFMRYIGRKK